MFYDPMLQIVRLYYDTCQVSYRTNHETLKQICFERANIIAGYGKTYFTIIYFLIIFDI